MKSNAPCYDCNDRYLGCHGRCPKYLEFSQNKEQERNERFKKLEINDGFVRAKCKSIRKKRKKVKQG